VLLAQRCLYIVHRLLHDESSCICKSVACRSLALWVLLRMLLLCCDRALVDRWEMRLSSGRCTTHLAVRPSTKLVLLLSKLLEYCVVLLGIVLFEPTGVAESV
jgi:hypothetical protein